MGAIRGISLVMNENEAPKTDAPGAYEEARLNKWNVLGLIVVGILIAGSAFALYKLNSTHQQKEVAAAQVVSDKAIAALQKRNGADARKLGTKKFRTTYSDKQLTDQFKAVEVATTGAPKLDVRIRKNTSSGKNIYFIYKYDRLKVPYYVRTLIVEDSGNWRLSNITGNIDESTLYVN